MNSNSNNNKRSFGLSQDTTFFLRKPAPIKKRELPCQEVIDEEVVKRDDDTKVVVEEISSGSNSTSNSPSSSNVDSVVEILDSTPQKPAPEAEKIGKKAKIAKSPSILDDLDPELLALISSSEDDPHSGESFKIDKTANLPISLKIEVRINNEQACQQVIIMRLASQEPFRNCLEEAGKKLKISLSQLILCTPHGVRVFPSSTPAILGTVDDAEFHLLDLRGYEKRKLRLQDELERTLAKKSTDVPEDELPEEELVDDEETTKAPPQTSDSSMITILVKSKNAQQAKQVSISRYDPIVQQILSQMEAEGKCRFDGQIINSTATADSLDMEDDDMVDFIQK